MKVTQKQVRNVMLQWIMDVVYQFHIIYIIINYQNDAKQCVERVCRHCLRFHCFHVYHPYLRASLVKG